MDIKGKVIAITGSGRGLGAAMALNFAKAGAAGISISDIREDDIKTTRAAIEALGCKTHGMVCDVSKEAAIETLINEAEDTLGPIDLFIANAGVGFGDRVPGSNSLIGPAWQQTNDQWQAAWNINVMQHVWAARHMVPRMVARGGGYFANVASAAGLMAQIGDSAYTVTKHAARAFAESLAIAHGHEGLKVSCICPQYVDTKMARMVLDAGLGIDNVLTPEEFGDAVTEGLKAETFFILPHPQVHDNVNMKYQNPDRWIGGMQKLRAHFVSNSG